MTYNPFATDAEQIKRTKEYMKKWKESGKPLTAMTKAHVDLPKDIETFTWTLTENWFMDCPADFTLREDLVEQDITQLRKAGVEVTRDTFGFIGNLGYRVTIHGVPISIEMR